MGMYQDRAQVKDSYVHMNDKPGFGIEIDWKFVEQHPA
jgi:L-alanine-DL-glutamate epimerase-like enolase superfamily enzyme